MPACSGRVLDLMRVFRYMADNFPHVFANREQYEASIRLPLGHEWNTLAAHRFLLV
jgi:U3 small nucleolar RNA-associated protein 14